MMQKTHITLQPIKLVGITVRTNNQNEMNPSSKIGPCVHGYFQQQLFDKIANRKNPGKTFCAYTDYESDYTGDYTFFIGEEVTSFDSIGEGLTTLSIPSQKYVKFTTESGSMPEVVINAWQTIWQTTPQDLGGIRRYHADFEIYDERARDPNDTILDIYVGIED